MILLMLESRGSLVLRLWALAALFCLYSPPAWAGKPRIETTAGIGEIHVPDAEMIPMQGGWAYRFPITIEASSPILGVTINGESEPTAFVSSLKISRAIRLKPGVNLVVVKAFTDEQVTERLFTLHADGLLADPLDAKLEAEAQEIMIIRPFDRYATDVQADELLEVPGGPFILRDDRFKRVTRGGLMYEFAVEVSAFLPIREVRINGESVSQPNNTWVRVEHPVYLVPGYNPIRVEAVTESQKADKTFTIRMHAERLPESPIGYPTIAPLPAPGAQDKP